MGIHLHTPQKSLYVGFASAGYVLEGFNPPKMGFSSIRDPLLEVLIMRVGDDQGSACGKMEPRTIIFVGILSNLYIGPVSNSFSIFFSI